MCFQLHPQHGYEVGWTVSDVVVALLVQPHLFQAAGGVLGPGSNLQHKQQQRRACVSSRVVCRVLPSSGLRAKHTHLVWHVPLVQCAAYGCDGHCRLGSRVAGLHAAHTHTPTFVQTMAAWCGSRHPATCAAAPVLQHTLVHCTYFSLCVPPFDSTPHAAQACGDHPCVLCNRLSAD